MAKPATKAATPAAPKPKEKPDVVAARKFAKTLPDPNEDGHVEVSTDAARPGPVGDRSPPTEGERIAAAAERGEGVEKLEGSDGEAGHVAPPAPPLEDA